MLLAVDIGNTNTDFGLFDKTRFVDKRKVATEDLEMLGKAWPEFRWGSHTRRIEAVLVASVRPPATPPVLEWAAETLRRPAVTMGIDCLVPIQVRVKNPRTVGIDRLVNALAAYRRFGGPAVVVDIGTAVAIDVVSERGEFLGGAIAPGITVAARALHRDCAQLPLLDSSAWRIPVDAKSGRRAASDPEGLSETCKKKGRACGLVSARRGRTPQRGAASVPAIGRCTEEALASGLYWGLVGTISQAVKEIETEFGAPMRIIATGGDVDLVVNHLRPDTIVAPELTLQGIVLAYLEASKMV